MATELIGYAAGMMAGMTISLMTSFRFSFSPLRSPTFALTAERSCWWWQDEFIFRSPRERKFCRFANGYISGGGGWLAWKNRSAPTVALPPRLRFDQMLEEEGGKTNETSQRFGWEGIDDDRRILFL